MRYLKYFLFLLLFNVSFTAAAFEWKLELGQTNIHSNFFEVPKSATRITFPEGKTQFSGRLYGTWSISDQDQIRFLLAPFTTKATLQSATAVIFMDESFAAGAPIDVSYTFNSYRVSYIRTWEHGPNLKTHFGLTGKIRDASIKLSNGTVSKERSNVGFVPLLNGGFDYQLAPDWLLAFDVDAAAAAQGRAIDGALEVHYQGFQNYQIGLGYRVLDGGVDTKDNLNFSQLRTTYLTLTSDLFE